MLRYDNDCRTDGYYKTERAPNLSQSQRIIELAIRLSEKESLTLFFACGISPPQDGAKLRKIFEMDAIIKRFYSTKNYVFGF